MSSAHEYQLTEHLIGQYLQYLELLTNRNASSNQKIAAASGRNLTWEADILLWGRRGGLIINGTPSHSHLDMCVDSGSQSPRASPDLHPEPPHCRSGAAWPPHGTDTSPWWAAHSDAQGWAGGTFGIWGCRLARQGDLLTCCCQTPLQWQAMIPVPLDLSLMYSMSYCIGCKTQDHWKLCLNHGACVVYM